MGQNNKTIPIRVNTDLSFNYFDEFTCAFLKNLTANTGSNNIIGSNTNGENAAVLKPFQSNEIYCNLQNEPDPGSNFCVGAKGFPQVNRVYVMAWNPNGNHFVYRINGDTRTCEMVKIDPCFNFQLDPKYFIHDMGMDLEVFTLVDPDTGTELKKEELTWTDGFNPQGFLRIQDSIDTNGFDPATFSYFSGTYDKCVLVRMGVPTPKDCIAVSEIVVPDVQIIHFATVPVSADLPNHLLISTIFGVQPLPGDIITIPITSPFANTYNVISSVLIPSINVYYVTVSQLVVPTGIGSLLTPVTLSRPTSNDGINNNLLFNTWQFRLRHIDVWGRPSEWGIISDMYVPGINDCLSVGSNLPTCLNLEFDSGNPVINTIEIAWRNCNDVSWRREATLFLYTGSNIGQWWLRPRNPDITYNPVTNKITYKFCRDKECDPIDPDETARLQPPQPKTSQSLFKLNNTRALANNKDGFNPFPQSLLNNIKLVVTPPGAANPNARNITIYVAIDNMQQQVYKSDNKYYYGGQFAGVFTSSFAESKKQFFKNTEQTGFCGYLVNGDSAISSQVYIDGNGQLLDDNNFNGYALSPTHRTLQKFVFNNVPKGTYIFAISSQTSNPSTEYNYRDTSTPMLGLCPFNKSNDYFLDLNDRTTYQSCELLVDCCNGDYDSMNDNKMLVIANMAHAGVYATSGYFYESLTDKTKWELLRVTAIGGNSQCSLRTDRNGFYWMYNHTGTLQFLVHAYSKCLDIFSVAFTVTGNGNIVFKDYYMETFFNGVGGNPYIASVCNTVQIKGRLLLDGTNIGVSNAVVSLTRGGQAVTDDDGYFTLLAHDDASNQNPYGQRSDKLIISGGACTYLAVGGGCIAPINIVFTNCSVCTDRVISVGTTLLIYLQERGLLSGGTYLPFINGYDWLGRKTYAQPLKQITIPSVIQTQAIGASVIQAIIDPAAIFPPEIEYITFSLTEETTIEKYLTWIVDRVEFIDNTNQINNTAPTQIKIYYQSIIEFSAVNNYNTTTAWQFIPTGQNTPAIADKVQFFLNGDGKFFTKNITLQVKYDQSGTYILVDYVSELKNLKQNALMRLIRPKVCTGTELNYEVCAVVNIVNRKAVINTFILNAFDTYYLSRQIPVPAPVAPTPQVTQIATVVANVTTYTTPVPVGTVLELRNFGFRFEHDSPSNFWGDGCKNIGRPNARNPFECEIIHPNQIAFSGALSANGQLNFLSYFDNAKKHDIEIADNSGIVAVIAETGMLYIITQNDNIVIGYNDNIARLDNKGNLIVPSGANTFGQPERKVGERYGCKLIDKMAIKSRNGFIMYPSRNRGEAMIYDFKNLRSLTKDESLLLPGVHKGKCDAMFKAKCKAMDADPSRYFTAAIDPISNEYLLTDFKLGDDPTYINQERNYTPLLNETLRFNIYTTDFLGWLSFTAENYAYLDGNILSNQLFSFMKAKAYSHYNVNANNSYNTFYGIVCERVMKIVANKPAFTKKQWLSLMNYCKQSLYFCPEIRTEAGQLSMLFLDNFDKAEFTSFAGFMSDVNTPVDPSLGNQVNNNPLYEGNQLYGLWLSALLVGEPLMNDKYSEFIGSTIESFNLEKTG